MLKLADFAKLGRPLRQDGVDSLGIATTALLHAAIDDGRREEAKALTSYLLQEGKGLHDLMCDWVWELLTRVADRHGEEEMYRILRASQGRSMLERTWKGFLAMSV